MPSPIGKCRATSGEVRLGFVNAYAGLFAWDVTPTWSPPRFGSAPAPAGTSKRECELPARTVVDQDHPLEDVSSNEEQQLLAHDLAAGEVCPHHLLVFYTHLTLRQRDLEREDRLEM